MLVDLGAIATSEASGAIWSLPHGGDLDANLVALAAGSGIDAHRNDEVDVLIVVRSGSGTVTVDDVARDVAGDNQVLIDRGAMRAISAGGNGLVYLSVHRARGPMTVRRGR
jgi:quercetin dioxygenase-like cupin family protein